MFKNTSLLLRFGALFVVVLGIIGAAYTLLLRDVYYAELHRQASSIADNVDAFGRWVAQYGRVWVRDKPDTAHLSRVGLGDPVAALAAVATPKGASAAYASGAGPTGPTFYSKNPALAQREFSEVVARSPTRAKFRMTSDNWMAAQNRPDAFELEAIAMIKNRNLDEYITVTDGQYRYARKIVHTEGCITCHGKPEVAPQEVLDRYGRERGFGFVAGDVAGIISVTLPMDPLWESSARVLGVPVMALVVLAFLVLFAFVYYGVVRPIQSLTTASHKISLGHDDVELDTDGLRKNTRSELGRLTLAIGRLKSSMEMAVEKMERMRDELREVKGNQGKPG